jgi:hypothetical protein
MSHPDERITAYRHTFAELFRDWHVSLPDNAVSRNAAGEVKSDAGSIQYRLHDDWGDEYLELFTALRGGAERVYRIHYDGRAELIAARPETSPAGRGGDDEQRFHHLLRDRGFRLPRP